MYVYIYICLVLSLSPSSFAILIDIRAKHPCFRMARLKRRDLVPGHSETLSKSWSDPSRRMKFYTPKIHMAKENHKNLLGDISSNGCFFHSHVKDLLFKCSPRENWWKWSTFDLAHIFQITWPGEKVDQVSTGPTWKTTFFFLGAATLGLYPRWWSSDFWTINSRNPSHRSRHSQNHHWSLGFRAIFLSLIIQRWFL